MKKANIYLINPHLIFAKNDLFTTGVVYLPVGLAYLASKLKQESIPFDLIDCFGEKPNQFRSVNNFVFRGLENSEIISKIEDNNPLIFAIYAINLAAHNSLEELVILLRKNYPSSKIIVFENSQAVTAYSLKKIQKEILSIGADFIATGDVEEGPFQLIKELYIGNEPMKREIPGVGYQYLGEHIYNNQLIKVDALDANPFPLWEIFPLENYWSLKYSHGPFETKKYLPLLTSRGCPYPCNFCVIPSTNDKKWRSRSAENVVQEMVYFYEKLGVTEFHIEDVDPTINENRTKEFCEKLLATGISFKWKICAGTKVETIRKENTLELMAKAGCNYISISPETGSEELLKKINKPFNLNHCIKLVQKMKEVGIYSQACFVLGFPGETKADREKTFSLVKQLTKIGLDEIAQFIVTPVPGSAIYDQFSGYNSFSDLNFSPLWRKDYDELNKFRVKLYRSFLIWKLIYNPLSLIKQPFYFLTRRFKTKMEMTPYRVLRTYYLSYRKVHS